MMMETWPISKALQRLQSAREEVQVLQQTFPGISLDIVVAHCREDLGWLRIALQHWSANDGLSRLFVYEKCGQAADIGSTIPSYTVPVVDDPRGGRKDECSAYLTHLAWAANGNNAAHFTLFLQADAF